MRPKNEAEQSLWWEEVSLKAMTLDVANFLDNSYSVPTFGDLGVSPSSSKRKLKSSQSSPLSQQKRRLFSHFMDADSDSEEEDEDEDDEGDQEGYGEEETEDQSPKGLDEMPTPTSRPSRDIPSSSGSSMLPPSSKTPKTPLMAGPPQKKRKRDNMASIAKQLADITQQNAASLAKIQMQAELAKQQTDLALAQIREDNAKERLANIELHRANQEFMRQETQTNRELSTQNREMLQILLAKIGVQPIATLPPSGSPPVLQLQGQPFGSSISNASSPSDQTKGPPPLSTNDPMAVPSSLFEENVAAPLSAIEIAEVEEDQQPQGTDELADENIQSGQNLSRDASELEPGSVALPIKDQAAGFAP